MDISRFAAAAVAIGMAVCMVGCMSMDEMLASEDGFWRDIGETKAVSFVLDSSNPIEKRLEVVPKIADQDKLAKIVIARNVASEVKAEARKRIDKTPALATVAMNAPERQDQLDALDQINKSENARIDAAWIFAASKPSSNALQTVLKGLSDSGKSRFAASFNEKIDAASEASAEASRLRQKYGDSMAEAKVKELRNILKSLVALAPYVEDENTIAAILQRQDIADVKETEYDFLTPLEVAYEKAVAERKEREAKAEAERKARESAALLATLTDDERVQLLEKGRIAKQGKTIIATDEPDATETKTSSGDTISRDDILKGIKDQALAAKMQKAEADRKARKEKVRQVMAQSLLARKQKEEALSKMRQNAFERLVSAGIIKESDINRVNSDYDNRTPEIMYKSAAEYLGKVSYYEGTSGVKKWMKALEVFKDTPELQQDFAEMLFEHAYTDFVDEQKLAELKKVIAVLPQSRVVGIFRSNITDKTVELKARVIAYGITDQAALKRLLVDDDSWARPRTKRCDWERRKNAYATLLSNVKDAKLADTIFCETRPTKNTEVITVGDILMLIDRLSETKRKELVDRAFARAKEAAKTTVVVEQYYVGMSYPDYELVNFSNGHISTGGISRFDDRVSRKMTHIGFTKENRIRKLGITQNNVIAACHQFAEKYGKVPDGKDVSGKTDVVAAIRTQEAYSDYAPGGTEFSGNSVWKWIDYVHDIQAEVETDSGNLVLCKAVIEGVINHKNIKKEQQAAVLDAWTSPVSDDDDQDMGPDPGLEPVGK